MITTQNISDAIKASLINASPSAQMYINTCPTEFQRPAYLISCTKIRRKDNDRSTIYVLALFTIKYFAQIAEDGVSDPPLLMSAQDTIQNLFRDGYMTVGDRNIKVKRSTGTINPNDASVNVLFEFFDDRTDKTDNTAIMGTVNIIIS